MSLIDRYYEWLYDLVGCTLPSLACDPARQFYFAKMLGTLLLLIAIGLLLFPLKFIRDPKTRIKTFAVLSASIVNFVVFASMFKAGSLLISPRQASALIFMNLLCAYAYYRISRLKIVNPEDPTGLKTDYGLNPNRTKSSFGFQKCPNCGNRNISFHQARHVPQTCNSCGIKVRAAGRPWIKITILIFELFAMFWLAYAVGVGDITRDYGRATGALVILSLIVTSMWPGKLVVVDEDAVLEKAL
jgi:ribosomal protein S27E